MEIVEIDIEVSSIYETIAIYASLISLAIGLLHLFFAKTAMGWNGLTTCDDGGDGGDVADSYGESRSSFAGIVTGLSASVFMFQQSTLFQTLGLAWGIGAVLLALGMVFSPKSISLFKLFCCLFGVFYAAVVVENWGMPIWELLQEARASVNDDSNGLLIFSIILTLMGGILGLLLPRFTLNRLLKLHSIKSSDNAFGSFFANSGHLALVTGFYLALGLFCYGHLADLETSQIFLLMTLIICWSLTAFGRVISMIVDKAWGGLNLSFLIFEIIMFGLPLFVLLKTLGFLGN